MAKKKKNRRNKNTSNAPVRLSPEKYVKTTARQLPIKACMITQNWQVMGLASVVVTRERPSGNLVMGLYLVDTMCLGVKDAHHYPNMTRYEYDEMLEEMSWVQNMVPCDYVLAHNVVYGGIEFARELGFEPHKDFGTAQYILEEDTDDIEFMDIDFGRNGEPVLFVKPGMKATRYIKQLNKSVGEGNYEVVYQEDMEDEVWEGEDGLPPIDMERPFRSMIERRLGSVKAEYAKKRKPSDAEMVPMEINYEPMDSPYTAQYADDPALQDTIDQMHDQALDKPKAAIPRLRKLIKKYPKHPAFRNYLMNALRLTDQQEEAREVVEKLYEEFPEYLYARIAYADLLIEEKKFTEAFQVFDNHYVLPRIYPDREVFHYTEVLSYNAFLSRYFLGQGDLDRAIIYYDVMYNLDEDHPETWFMENTIGAKMLSEVLGKLTE